MPSPPPRAAPSELGVPLVAHGTLQQLKALLIALSEQVEPGAAVLVDVHAEQWMYEANGKREGPFSMAKLARWHAKGFFADRAFRVQHAASQLWLPLFHLLKMFPDAPAAARRVCERMHARHPRATPKA